MEGKVYPLCSRDYKARITYYQTRKTPTILLQELLREKTLGEVTLKANKY
jgi:hypothetical protein